MASKEMHREIKSISRNENIFFKLLHWVIAVLIIFQGVLGAAMLHIASLHPYLASALLIHEETGLLILLLTACLLFLRIITGRRSGSETHKIHQQWARMVHLAFYGLIFLEGALGIWMIGLLGKDLTIGIWHLPLPVSPDPQFVFSSVLLWHAAVALSLAALIVIHSLAALYHHYVLRDQVLNNMNPFRGRHSVDKT